MTLESHFYVTLIQFEVDFGSVERNFEHIKSKLSNLNQNLDFKPNIIVLPELFSTLE